MTTAIIISVIWVLVSFVVMIASFLINFPASEERRASKEDLDSLGDVLNGSKVLAEFSVNIAKLIMWAHRLFAGYWTTCFAVGMASILLPPVPNAQGEARAIILSSGLIFSEIIAAIVQGVLLFVTLAMRESRKDWRVAAARTLQAEAAERQGQAASDIQNSVEEIKGVVHEIQNDEQEGRPAVLKDQTEGSTHRNPEGTP